MLRMKLSMKRLMGMTLGLALTVTGMPVTAFAGEAYAVEEASAAIGAEAAGLDIVAEGSFGIQAEDALGAVEAADASQDIPAQAAKADDLEAAGEGEEKGTIEINQGFSYHTGLNDGNETYLETFVARKKTAVMMKIPGSASISMDEAAAKEAVKNYKLEAKAVTNGQEADNCELTADGDAFSVKRVLDKDCDLVAGWYAVANFPTGPDKGTYNFHLKDGDNEIGVHNGVTFYETQKLNVLVVPVNAYWSAKYEGGAPEAGAYTCKSGKFYDDAGNERDWSDLCTVLKEYMLDVYPIADITFEEGQEIQANDASYDMCNEADANGQKKLWEEACKLQSKTKDGKDRYDLILAFVQYRQDKGGGQGYTFGKPTNIITYSDKDMLPTVAHEIAHCYQVGDEYDGGSFNINVNYPPNGYGGRDFVTGNEYGDKKSEGAADYWKDPAEYKKNASEDKKEKIDESGKGTMVSLGLRPYSLGRQEFIQWKGATISGQGVSFADTVQPTISWMGSGYSGSQDCYWTTSVIWDHLLKQLAVKEKKEENTEETTNAQVFENAIRSGVKIDENSIFTDEDDFYFDDDCRFGESRMVEVNGWLIKNDTGVSANLSPMFSYDGDLETIEVLDEAHKVSGNSANLYTFVALDKDGKVIKSPVDEQFSAVPFSASFVNTLTNKTMSSNEVHFGFDAEYPEGTADFAIMKGLLPDSGALGTIVWQASKDPSFKGEFDKKVDGYLNYADVNSKEATVEWELYYPEDSEEPYDNKDKKLYTEVYYCPEGDDGEAYYVGCSDDKDWTEGSISFNTASFNSTGKASWTRNAYVWIKVTNGVNAVDIYSDENEITLCNSTIALSGKGFKKKKVGNETTYSVEYTGSPITPATTVKAMNPETGKYISLKKDVDYTVTYENNVKTGYASVIVQGIGLYAGKNTQEFEIKKKTLNATPDSLPDFSYGVSLNNAVRPYLSMSDAAGNVLINDKDFYVKYTAGGKTEKSLEAVVASDPSDSVTVTVGYFGKGNYTGQCKKKVKFDVLSSKKEVVRLSDNKAVTLKKTSFQYTGKPIKPAVKSVTISVNGTTKKLSSKYYKVIYANNVSIGTGRVTILGRKGYTGSISATFTIEPKKVKSLSITGVKNQPYTGKAVSVNDLPIVVKAGGITLVKGTDYTVESGAGDYTKVTEKGAAKPQVVVKLITMTDAQKAKTKSSLIPKVEWAEGVSDSKKAPAKTFSIVKTKLNSSAVTFSEKSSQVSSNVIRSADKSKVIGYIRSASKEEKNKDKKKYAFVIEGTEDALEKDAVITDGACLKAYGIQLEDGVYKVTVKKTNNGKIGTITCIAENGKPYAGKKTVKFLYKKKG